MRWTDATPGAENSVKIPNNWLFLHYYEALSILFRIENTLRTFVYVVLKDKHKDEWRSLSIGTDDGGQTTIDAAAKRRAAQDDAFGYLGYTISSPLMYLTSGELIRLVLSEAYWPLFAPYFPTTKGVVQTKLEEIGNIRNALAHFRPLKPDDVQVVRQNANQVLSRVEEMLVKLVDIGPVVPTNTTDRWYTELRALGGANVVVGFNQSDDERWVCMNLEYACPLIEAQSVLSNYRSYRYLTVLTPPMLRTARAIRENAIFASEWIPYGGMEEGEDPNLSKRVQFYFSRESLGAVYERIKPELEELIRKITAETELIVEDNLARGEFVRTAYVSASRSGENARWNVATGGLQSPVSDSDPVEYWAGKPLFSSHFLTNTESFPWMPVNISNFSPPF